MRRKDFTTAPISIETCYAEGLPQTYMPVLLHVSGNKFVYHKEIDECTNEITEGFCVCDEWHHTPVLLNSEKQRALLHYFFNCHWKAIKYAKENDWKGINLVQLFPCVTYELLPHSVNIMDDGSKVTGILELWDDEEPALCISKINDDDTLADFGSNKFEQYVISIINKSFLNTFIDMISKDNRAHFFRILIPIISSKFGEREEIRHVNCSWKRILKIASYYSRFGLVTVYWDESNLLLWASCCHKRLPIPFTRFDVEQANREWCQKICDNPFLEHSFREDDNLNKWDYEILQKARKIMEDDDLPK
jgi:hypothetical protein